MPDGGAVLCTDRGLARVDVAGNHRWKIEAPPCVAAARGRLTPLVALLGGELRTLDQEGVPIWVAPGAGAGALALFSGVVRDQTGGRRVKFLEYEAHGPMALAKMREIALAIRRRWPIISRIAVVHRIGRLEIGESSVMIAVSSPHRAEAFEACRFAIDTLKETVPIWKKEHFEDGEVWVGLQSG